MPWFFKIVSNGRVEPLSLYLVPDDSSIVSEEMSAPRYVSFPDEEDEVVVVVVVDVFVVVVAGLLVVVTVPDPCRH